MSAEEDDRSRADERGASGGSQAPARLWAQAEEEHPNDPHGRATRYLELMTEAGHIVPKEPGDDSPLFSCGYDPRRAGDDEMRAVAMEMTALAKRLIREAAGRVVDPMASLDVAKVKAAEDFLRRNP